MDLLMPDFISLLVLSGAITNILVTAMPYQLTTEKFTPEVFPLPFERHRFEPSSEDSGNIVTCIPAENQVNCIQ